KGQQRADNHRPADLPGIDSNEEEKEKRIDREEPAQAECEAGRPGMAGVQQSDREDTERGRHGIDQTAPGELRPDKGTDQQEKEDPPGDRPGTATTNAMANEPGSRAQPGQIQNNFG